MVDCLPPDGKPSPPRRVYTPEDRLNAHARPSYCLDYYLESWRRWMTEDRDVLPDAYEKRAAGMESALTNFMVTTDDADIVNAMLEAAEGPAVDACIRELDYLAELAIHNKLLYAVWRFPRIDLESEYRRARSLLKPLLNQRFINFQWT